MGNGAEFSRSGATDEFGKCAERLTLLLPEEVKNELTAKAVLHGSNLSEWGRRVIEDYLFGSFRGDDDEIARYSIERWARENLDGKDPVQRAIAEILRRTLHGSRVEREAVARNARNVA